jgi:flagellar assembly protein FliH
VFPPDDDRPASPLVWRQVGAAAAAGEAAPDPSARLAQLETLYRQKALEAHAAGVREGEIAGRNRATAELQPVLERLGRAIEEIANLRARLRWEAEADVVQLALAIARRVIRRELASDPDALRGLAMAALEKLQGQEIARVKVHPSHVAMVKSCLQQALSGGLVEVLADPSRAVGSVIFETTRGNLDASVDSQLQEIERGLADRLRKQS